MSGEFKERSLFGVLHRVDNTRCIAGHARLFGKNGASGWSFYRYNQTAKGWALHRVWSFGLFAIHHVGEGKSCDPMGWHVTWARLVVKKIYGGYNFQALKADTFRVSKPQ